MEMVSLFCKTPSPGREEEDNLLDGAKLRWQKNLVTLTINHLSMFYKGVLILLFT